MLDKQQGTDRTKGEEHKADQPSGKSPDPILKKLRYPKTSGYRVKYEEDELAVVPDETSGYRVKYEEDELVVVPDEA